MEGKYCVLIVGPELILDPQFFVLWKDSKFVSQVDHLIIDEAHVVCGWGQDFQPEFLQLWWLYNHIQHQIPWYLTLATLDPSSLSHTLHTLNMNPYDMCQLSPKSFMHPTHTLCCLHIP